LATGDAPGVQKVLVGLEKTSDLVVPKTLLNAGFVDAAEQAVQDQIKTSPASATGAKVLQAQIADYRIAVAKALDDAGDRDAATEQVKKAVADDPSVEVPSQLKPEDGRLAWWQSALGAIGPWVRTIAEIILVALGAFALIAILWRFGRRSIRRSLELGEITGDGGKDASAGLREQCTRLRNHYGGIALEQVSASGAPYAIPADVSKAFPTANLIVAILDAINRLVPGRRWHIAGTTSDGGPRHGPALTVTIARGSGRVLSAETFRLSNWRWRLPEGKPTGADWQRLALPAAVWLTFTAGRRSPRRFHHFKVLGTESWQSYTLFAAGAETGGLFSDASHRQLARRLYLDALSLDPRNQGATLNLASVEILEVLLATDDNTKQRLGKRARERLDGLVNDLARRAPIYRHPLDRNRFERDPLWYRARYLQMVGNLEPIGDDATAAYQAGLAMVTTMLKRLAKLDHWWRHPRWRNEALRTFLAHNEGQAVAALARASAATDLEIGDTSLGAATALRKRRRKLHDVLASMPADRKPSPDVLADYAEQPVFANAMCQYNLACYYATTDETELAEKRLRTAIALGGPSLAEQAEIDPDLSTLGKQVLDTIVADEEGPETEPALVPASGPPASMDADAEDGDGDGVLV
jgi:hypothetical protein